MAAMMKQVAKEGRNNDMSPSPSIAKATAARLQMEAVSTFPANRARHVFGPLEEARMKVYPGVLTSAIEMIGNVPHEGKIESRMLTVGTKATTFNLDVKCDGAELTLTFSVIEPVGSVRGLRAEPFTNGDWEEIEENPLLSSESGVAGNVWVRVLPQYVSFQHIRMLEGTAPAVSIWGCCTNQVLFPPDDIAHGVTAGGTPSYAQQETAVLEDNLLGPDRVAFGPPGNLEFPCDGGGYSFDIPWKWYADHIVVLMESAKDDDEKLGFLRQRPGRRRAYSGAPSPNVGKVIAERRRLRAWNDAVDRYRANLIEVSRRQLDEMWRAVPQDDRKRKIDQFLSPYVDRVVH